MLRLVHPAPAGQDATPSRRRRGSKPAALILTADERRHVRAALRNIARAYGGNDALAIVLDLPLLTIYGYLKKNRSISGTFAIRLAKVAGVSVETILSGGVATAGRCPTCGHQAGRGR